MRRRSGTGSSGRSGDSCPRPREVDTRSLLRRIYALFRGIETPDRELVERCVAAYATQTDEGRWRLQDQDALVARQASQAQVLAELIDTGHRLGFKVHVGRDVERRALPSTHAERGRVMTDLVTEAERSTGASRFVRGASEALDFVDCVWYDRGHMVFLWQVDWTARIHRSIVALGEAIPDDDRVFRFLRRCRRADRPGARKAPPLARSGGGRSTPGLAIRKVGSIAPVAGRRAEWSGRPGSRPWPRTCGGTIRPAASV